MGIGLRVYTGPDTPAWVYAEGVFDMIINIYPWYPKLQWPEFKVPEIRLNCSEYQSHDCWADASFPYYPDPLYQVVIPNWGLRLVVGTKFSCQLFFTKPSFPILKLSCMHVGDQWSSLFLVFQELYFGFIREFHNHLETLPSFVRHQIIFIQVIAFDK